MVGIHTHLRRQVEGYGEPGGALGQQIAIAPVALLGRAEAGILPHGPEAAAIHVAIDAACIGELTGLAETAGHEREILRARQNDEMPYQAIISAHPIATTKRKSSPLDR